MKEVAEMLSIETPDMCVLTDLMESSELKIFKICPGKGWMNELVNKLCLRKCLQLDGLSVAGGWKTLLQTK